MHRVRPRDEAFIATEVVKSLRRHLAEEDYRILPTLAPRVGIDGREEVSGRGMPRPPQVHRQGLQDGEALGEHVSDRESTQCLHVGHRNAWRRTG